MPHVQPMFADADLETIARALADAPTHRQLTDLFAQRDLPQVNEGPKWRQITLFFRAAQARDQCGNAVLSLISAALRPAAFVHDKKAFAAHRERLNLVMAFHGLSYGEDGRFYKVQASATIDEAQARAARLKTELERRDVHPDVLRFCTAELLQENYFHAVLEATKSVSAKLREKSGEVGDAGQLAQAALGLGPTGIPILAFNAMSSGTEISEQKGLANLFLGMFGTFRNTTGHEPKISWPVTERDAMDLLTLVSFLHRRLDGARRMRSS